MKRTGWARKSPSAAARRLEAAALCAMVIALMILALAPSGLTQPTGRVPRVGVLGMGDDQGTVTVVNLRAARALGLTMSPAVLQRADQVLQ